MKTPMRFSLLSTIILTLTFYVCSAGAYLTKPLCVAIGTPYEGWIIPGEENLIQSGNCADKVMECAQIGTRSEGWYVFEKQNIKLLEKASCRFEIVQPVCMFVGTPNEGWVVPARGMRIYYEPCAGKGAECSGQSYTNEGWYVFNKKPLGLFMYSSCGQSAFEY